jgi:Flp pilus assembly protein TadB
MSAAIAAVVMLAAALALLVYASLRPAAAKLTYGTEASTHVRTDLPGFVDRSVGNFTSWRFMSRLSGYEDPAALRAIEQSGNPWAITLPQYYALVAIAALAGGTALAALAVFLGGVVGLAYGSFGMVPVAGLAAFAIGALAGSRYPLSHMRSIVNGKHRQVMLHLHEALDMFSMATSTGASIPQAMDMTREYLLEGALRDEVGRVCDDVANGVPFATAASGMHTRVPTKRVLTFVRMLRDANADGKDRTDRLRREAAEIREDQQRLMEKRSGVVQMVFIIAIVAGLLPLMLIPFVVPFATQLMSAPGALG